ncbi:MAG: exosortase T [Pseudomonadales bacterium]
MSAIASNPPYRSALSRVTIVLFALGAASLAADPLLWLIRTWHDQGYDGIGWIAAALVAGLGCWSGSSSLETDARDRPNLNNTFKLLLATACLRLTSQLLDVSVLGALLLGVDVFALARLARLSRRRRALAAFWLAVLFCFSLPVEPMLQRVFGYLLQQISASLACGILSVFFDNLSCAGVRLQVSGVDVLVDLPCSGAELISTTGMIFSFLCTLRRPSVLGGVIGAVACGVIALAGNALRITLLATGLVYTDLLPFQVMDPLPHTLIGLFAVAVASAALIAIVQLLPVTASESGDQQPQLQPGAVAMDRHRLQLFGALCFLLLALAIGTITPRPLDASPALPPAFHPGQAAGLPGETQPLTEQERQYFSRYGGAAQRVNYGPYSLLLVSTTSPLRHLHDPAICLRGLGYQVRLLGTDHATRSTVYSAAKNTGTGAPDERFTLRVSYLGSDGQIATSIAEVVWYWLNNPATRWTMVQRATPDHSIAVPEHAVTTPSDAWMAPIDSADRAAEWETAMRRAFNLS